jgi:hypothetical protein
LAPPVRQSVLGLPARPVHPAERRDGPAAQQGRSAQQRRQLEASPAVCQLPAASLAVCRLPGAGSSAHRRREVRLARPGALLEASWVTGFRRPAALRA